MLQSRTMGTENTGGSFPERKRGTVKSEETLANKNKCPVKQF